MLCHPLDTQLHAENILVPEQQVIIFFTKDCPCLFLFVMLSLVFIKLQGLYLAVDFVQI